MSMVLSHSTALEMYRSSLMLSTKPELISYACLSLPTTNDVSAFHSLPVETAHLPLRCVVPRAGNRREIKECKCHVFGSEASMLRLRQTADGSLLCVVPPEVLFLQMAEQLSMVSLVKLGCELCGSYSLPMTKPSGSGSQPSFNRRSPLTSVAKILAFLDAVGQIRCIKKARAAMRYVVDGCASPKEAELCILLVLPRRVGGYGLNRPAVNHVTEASECFAELLPNKQNVCDLLWLEAGIALEYGGKPPASESVQDMLLGASSCTVLDMPGVEVVPITNRHIRHASTLDGIANTVARKHGRGLRCDQRYDFASRQTSLREEVLGRK